MLALERSLSNGDYILIYIYALYIFMAPCLNKRKETDLDLLGSTVTKKILLKDELIWNRSVSMAMGFWLDGREFVPGMGNNFFLSTASRPAEAHPASYPMGTGANFPMVG
jgi:hypothetical protein